jgi:hypothetical protein
MLDQVVLDCYLDAVDKRAMKRRTQESRHAASVARIVIDALRADLRASAPELDELGRALGPAGYTLAPVRVLDILVWTQIEPRGYYRWLDDTLLSTTALAVAAAWVGAACRPALPACRHLARRSGGGLPDNPCPLQASIVTVRDQTVVNAKEEQCERHLNCERGDEAGSLLVAAPRERDVEPGVTEKQRRAHGEARDDNLSTPPSEPGRSAQHHK